MTLTAKTDDSFVVESVQLLSSDEADQAKQSLLKLLHLAIHIHSRDRNRTIEWTDDFSPITVHLQWRSHPTVPICIDHSAFTVAIPSYCPKECIVTEVSPEEGINS